MKLKWKLVLVHLETVLVSVQYRFMVCVERTIGSEIVLDAPMEQLGDLGHMESHFFLFGDNVSVAARLTHPMELQGDVGHLESRFFPFGTVSVLVQDRCMLCAKHTRGS